jgi:LacI family transcriptional regulator
MNQASQKVTIQDVARIAGVSVTTVSRVLNEKDDVSAVTYAKVQAVIEDLGYASSLAARSMRSSRTNVIGLILSDLYQSFTVEVARGVYSAVAERDFDLLVYSGRQREGDKLSVWEQEQVALINGSITDGIIVAAPHAVHFRTDYPLVAVDPHNEAADYPTVLSTNRIGVMDAMEYLIESGHRRIGFISGRADLTSAWRRYQGYQDGLAKAGISLDPEIVMGGDYSREAGYSGALTLFAQPDRVTAIMAANDQSAVGVLDAAKAVGLIVPDDISVVGFDNSPETSMTEPSLTTVNQSVEEMGYIAAGMLIDLINGEQIDPLVRKVETQLVIRKSCALVE